MGGTHAAQPRLGTDGRHPHIGVVQRAEQAVTGLETGYGDRDIAYDELLARLIGEKRLLTLRLAAGRRLMRDRQIGRRHLGLAP